MDIADKKRSGRPREVDRAAVVNAAEAHPSMTTRMLAEDFDCHHAEIARILHAAGKKWLKSRWFPKELTEAQKRKRVEIATKLLCRHRRSPFFDFIVTCDEKWIPFVNDERHDLGWEILDHPPYSPDMAPSDFYLFRSLEHWLRGKKFRTIEEMRQSLTEFFDSKNREWYRHGIHRLEEQWQKVIENHGEYFDY
uniref:Transposase n=1 Tax=Acrobeloides nanus TaxID=290746 RepID=A0A914EJM2_9BILA